MYDCIIYTWQDVNIQRSFRVQQQYILMQTKLKYILMVMKQLSLPWWSFFAVNLPLGYFPGPVSRLLSPCMVATIVLSDRRSVFVSLSASEVPLYSLARP